MTESPMERRRKTQEFVDAMYPAVDRLVERLQAAEQERDDYREAKKANTYLIERVAALETALREIAGSADTPDTWEAQAARAALSASPRVATGEES